MKPDKPLNVTGMFDDNLNIGMIKFHNPEVIPDTITKYCNICICCGRSFTSGYQRFDTGSSRLDIFLNPKHPYFIVESREDMDDMFKSINEYNGKFDAKKRLTTDIMTVVKDALKAHFENTPIERYYPNKEK